MPTSSTKHSPHELQGLRRRASKANRPGPALRVLRQALQGDQDPRRFFEGKPINWPLEPNNPATPGWLSIEFLVKGRSAQDLATQLHCTEEKVHTMLERLGVSNPSEPRTAGPKRLLHALGFGMEHEVEDVPMEEMAA